MPDGIPTALQNDLNELEAARQQEADPSGPAGEDAIPTQQDARQPQPSPAAPRQQPTQQPAPTANTKPAREDDWKHRFDVIRGKYDAEVPRLSQELKEREARIKALEQEREQWRTNAQTPASERQEPTETRTSAQTVSIDDVSDDEVASRVSPEMIDEFGMDFWKQQIALGRSFAQTSTGTELAEIKERQIRQDRTVFYQELSALSPEWERVNSTPEFETFLGTVNPLTGATYEELLRSAYTACDSSRAASIFDTFFAQNPQSPNNGGGSNVAGQVMPGQVPTRTAPSVDDQIDFADWSRQMDEITRAGYSPAEVIQRQKKLMAQWTEGRVANVPADGGGGGRADFV